MTYLIGFNCWCHRDVALLTVPWAEKRYDIAIETPTKMTRPLSSVPYGTCHSVFGFLSVQWTTWAVFCSTLQFCICFHSVLPPYNAYSLALETRRVSEGNCTPNCYMQTMSRSVSAITHIPCSLLKNVLLQLSQLLQRMVSVQLWLFRGLAVRQFTCVEEMVTALGIRNAVQTVATSVWHRPVRQQNR